MEQKRRIYAAYGSNINLSQMAKRCPNAKVIGTGWLVDYRLVFRGSGFATVEPCMGRKVPVLLWEITPECEEALDVYEGFPRHYGKKEVSVDVGDGEKINAMLYIMTPTHSEIVCKPSRYYIDVIRSGYTENGLPIGFLREAVAENMQECVEAK